MWKTICGRTWQFWREIHRKVKETYGESTMTIQQVCRWCVKLKKGHTDLGDKPHSGSSTVQTDDVKRVGQIHETCTTINGAAYRNTQNNLRKVTKQKRPGLLTTGVEFMTILAPILCVKHATYWVNSAGMSHPTLHTAPISHSSTIISFQLSNKP